MRHFRFSIGSLLILVLFLAFSFAALREATNVWDQGVFSLAAGLLLVSVLLAVHRRERARAFWLGFALFGATYLGLSLIPTIESRLITKRGLELLDGKMQTFRSLDATTFGLPDVFFLSNQGNGSALLGTSGSVPIQGYVTPADAQNTMNPAYTINLLPGPQSWSTVAATSGTSANSLRIGHSLLALAFAFAGGLLSRRLHER